VSLPSLSPPLLVLASLADGPKHGYAMTQDIAEVSGNELGPGTLYGAIARLEERGWIEPFHEAAGSTRRRGVGLVFPPVRADRSAASGMTTLLHADELAESDATPYASITP